MRVYGVEPVGSEALKRALDAGEPVPDRRRRASPTASARRSPARWRSTSRGATSTTSSLLDDPTILGGLRFAIERLKQVLEPAGAAALAAVLTGAIPIRDGDRVCVDPVGRQRRDRAAGRAARDGRAAAASPRVTDPPVGAGRTTARDGPARTADAPPAAAAARRRRRASPASRSTAGFVGPIAPPPAPRAWRDAGSAAAGERRGPGDPARHATPRRARAGPADPSRLRAPRGVVLHRVPRAGHGRPRGHARGARPRRSRRPCSIPRSSRRSTCRS